VGRKSHSRALGVWANGLRVGTWRIPSSGPMEFAYDPAWVEAPEARPLSLSLPINLDGLPTKGDRVGFFFENLLPESETIRRRVQARFGTRSRDAFDLLEAIGRDCVGAVQLLPEDRTPEGVFEIHAEPLTDKEIERALVSATAEPTLSVDEDMEDFRISLAGAQEKTALTWHDGRWCRPRGSTPTTHIFKLPLGLVGGRQMDMRTSIENEWLCAQLLARLGLPVAACEILSFGSTKALVVTRFDRALHSSGNYWLRLPQEDFCQATGTPSDLKYETDGGPGLVEIAGILQASEVRDQDLVTLLRAQLVFWGLAATDGHAKNFSIRLLAKGRYRLTPLYDVLSAWPIAGSGANQIHAKKLKLAMAVRGKDKHYRVAEIQRRHFNDTARRCGLGLDMEAIIADTIARVPSAIESVAAVLPAGFPVRLFDAVTAGLRRSMRTLEKEPAG
jgi:serine/threonine-protein kinase HipA